MLLCTNQREEETSVKQRLCCQSIGSTIANNLPMNYQVVGWSHPTIQLFGGITTSRDYEVILQLQNLMVKSV